jgi:hypothetical protein
MGSFYSEKITQTVPKKNENLIALEDKSFLLTNNQTKT